MIGGNVKGILQICTTTKNKIGEAVKMWYNVKELTGFLDLQTGDSDYQKYSTKLQESTHVFISDYMAIPDVVEINGVNVKVTTENARMIVKSQRYDVVMIDNPMELNKHLEIFLKYTGGQ